jgi:uncharacterized protein (TIGR02453 family)
MAFAGFPPAAFAFLRALEEDNSKRTFDAQRAAYDDALMAPARELVADLGEALQARVSPGIHADPRVNGSIFRINRDTRFSKDKTPYKTHLDLYFWEGQGRSRDCPGLFFRMTPRAVVLGAGFHHFDPPRLARFRAAVVDEKAGGALDTALAGVRRAGAEIGGETYKRVPAGVDAAHPRAALLRHGGLFAYSESPLPREASSPAFVGWCAGRLERLAPVHCWLRDTVFAPEQ